MKYRIYGTDRETYAPVDLVVEADDPMDAEGIATAKGIVVTQTVPAEASGTPGGAGAALPPGRTAAGTAASARGLRSVIVAVVLFLVVAVLAGAGALAVSLRWKAIAPVVWTPPPPPTVPDAATRRTNLERMAALCHEPEDQIETLTAKAEELLRAAGITQDRDALLAGVLEVYPKNSPALSYAECMATYVQYRKEEGLSHAGALQVLREMFRMLGAR